jgi:hypothetical protein
MNKGEWDNVGCSSELQFVCSREAENSCPTTTTTTTTTTACFTCGSWTQVDDKCFELFTDTKSWSDAQTYCSDTESADLASIESQDEQDAVFGLSGNTNTWIGANGTATDATTWNWVESGDLIALWPYDNWAKNRPRTKKNKDCTKMNKGEWDNVGCSSQLQFVCSKSTTPC